MDSYERKRIKSAKLARVQLKRLDAWLVKHQADGGSKALWDVLSALRGPDQGQAGNSDPKMSSTVYVRQRAFPRVARSGVFFVAMKPDRQRIPFKSDSLEYGHFRNHIHAAAEVLGLKEKVVKPAKPPEVAS